MDRSKCRPGLVIAMLLLAAACGGGGAGNDGAGQAQPPPNQPPVLANPLGTHQATVGVPFSYDASQDGNTFRDPDGDPITYRLSWVDWVPAGLEFDGPVVSGTAGEHGAAPVRVEADDGRGGIASTEFGLWIAPANPPYVAQPNEDRLTSIGAFVEVDVIQGGKTFAHPDGLPLTVDVTPMTPLRGLQINGTTVSGHMDSIGSVQLKVTARHEYGASVDDEFFVAAPGPEPGRPNLPEPMFVYDDEELDLPFKFRQSREIFFPFWDTTPPGNPTTNAGATLGRVLFYDKRLSVTNSVSCGSCHEQQFGFAKPERFTEGFQGELTRRNAMALTNVRHNLFDLYFGDQRAFTLEALVLMPIVDPVEMGNSLSLLEQKLADTDFYPPLFAAAFGTPEITRQRIALALAQFLRSLISYRSRFDQAFHPMSQHELPDPASVLTAQEMRGAEVFEHEARCGTSCHLTGVQIFDAGAQNNGLDEMFGDPGAGNGRFRSPSLRNVAVSGPYMHDGRFNTLREVIEHYDSGVQDGPFVSLMMRGMVGSNPLTLDLSEEDKDALEAFLHTLTDEEFLTDPRFADPFE